MSILGTRVARVEDPTLITGGGVYTDDLRLPELDGAAHLVLVRSPMAHAAIGSVDVGAAAAAPGVVAVWTAKDLADLSPMAHAARFVNQQMLRPWLAGDRVRFVGEPVAAVLADTLAQAVDAAELVEVDYDPLPPVIGTAAAVAEGAELLFPEAGTNVAATFGKPLAGDPFADCEVVVTERLVNQRLHAVPLEPRAAAAVWGDDGRVTLWCTNQGAQAVKHEVCTWLGLDPDLLRVRTPDVGGGFGARIGADPEYALAVTLARRLGRPVRWAEARSESMTGMVHGRGQDHVVTIGGHRDGRVTAYTLEVHQDVGAYPRLGTVLPSLTLLMQPGVYDIPAVHGRAWSVVTNTTSVGAYRGAGRPEATAAVERAMDLFAAEIGMDPVEVRRRNLAAPFTEPRPNGTGATYDTGDYAMALDRVLDAAGYRELRAEQARRRERGDVLQLGVGVSCYVEITGAGPLGTWEDAQVDVHADGSATVWTGTSPHGQGHATAWAMIVHDRTGIPLDRISVQHGDTDRVPRGGGTLGSRSLQQGGAAVHQASVELMEQARQRAADALEADVADVEIDAGRSAFTVTGTASSVTLAELAANEPFSVKTTFTAAAPTFPFGAHLAVVEVDVETGKCRLLRIVTVDDAGRILNPLLAEGQRHGGIAQGVAQALFEEFRYDEDGNPTTASLADYAIVSAAELPSFELLDSATETPVNPLGAKGLGEAGTIGATPAVQSAVVDAVAHLGVRHIDMPATPQRVWRAIRAATAAG